MEKRCANYILTAPYPPVPTVKPDAGAARRLLADYAGNEGELTAITQYFYNSLLAPLAGESGIGDLFACVSRVEMHHLELIGKLILAYGGDPGFLAYSRNNRPTWWDGSNVNYDKSPQRMLEAALRGERDAVENYKRTAAYVSDAGCRALIARIIADEEHHIALFTGALHDLSQK